MILGHVESVASKKDVKTSVVIAMGTALGFSLVLIMLGGIRQLLGLLTPFATQPVGSFFVIGIALAMINYLKGYSPQGRTDERQQEPDYMQPDNERAAE